MTDTYLVRVPGAVVVAVWTEAHGEAIAQGGRPDGQQSFGRLVRGIRVGIGWVNAADAVLFDVGARGLLKVLVDLLDRHTVLAQALLQRLAHDQELVAGRRLLHAVAMHHRDGDALQLLRADEASRGRDTKFIRVGGLHFEHQRLRRHILHRHVALLRVHAKYNALVEDLEALLLGTTCNRRVQGSE